jgi:HSP90 family molecular chaperone
VQAIWLRKPQDVSTEEYHKFYKAVSRDYQEPLGWAHFKAEGDVEFKWVLQSGVSAQSPAALIPPDLC